MAKKEKKSSLQGWAEVIKKSGEMWDRKRVLYFRRHPDLGILIRIGIYLYEEELKETCGGRMPEDAKSWKGLTTGQRVRFLTEAENHYNYYLKTKEILEKTKRC